MFEYGVNPTWDKLRLVDGWKIFSGIGLMEMEPVTDDEPNTKNDSNVKETNYDGKNVDNYSYIDNLSDANFVIVFRF